MAPSQAKKDTMPPNGVTALGVVLILISPPPKSGAKLRASFCAVVEMSVCFTSHCASSPPRKTTFSYRRFRDKFNCTKEQLASAVQKGGHGVGALKRHFNFTA